MSSKVTSAFVRVADGKDAAARARHAKAPDAFLPAQPFTDHRVFGYDPQRGGPEVVVEPIADGLQVTAAQGIAHGPSVTRARRPLVKGPKCVGRRNARTRAHEKDGDIAQLRVRLHEHVAGADGLVVPGVGAFASVMDQLRAVGAPRLIDRRLAGGRPVLGICVGMQVMFDSSTEHAGPGRSSQGLGQWPGTVERLRAEVVPHMGWSLVRPPAGTVLFDGVEDERFYFVHSYAAKTDPAVLLGPGPSRPPLTTWATHGEDFVAAVENGALTATQFHPEKSGDAGARLLRNWLTTL